MREESKYMTSEYEVKKLSGDLYGENSYLCYNSQTKTAIIIDPGTDKFAVLLERLDLNLQGVLLTHGHIDHISAVDFYASKYHVPVYIHALEKRKLRDPELNLSSWDTPLIVEAVPTCLQKAKGSIQIADITILYSVAAGHSEGNLIYQLEGTHHFFVGDTIFSDSIGRYDLPGSNAVEQLKTLKRFLDYPAKSKIYAGHGKNFMIGDLAKNLVFQQFINQGM